MGRRALRRVARRVPRRARGVRGDRPRERRGVEKHMESWSAPDARARGVRLWDARAAEMGARRTRAVEEVPRPRRPGTGRRRQEGAVQGPGRRKRRGGGRIEAGAGAGSGTSRRHVAVRGGGGHRRRPRRRGTRRRARRAPRGGCVVRRSCSDTSPASSRRWRRWAPSRRRTARSAGSATRTARGCGPSCDASAPGRVRGWRGVDRVIGVGARRGAQAVWPRGGGGGGRAAVSGW